MKYAFAIVYLLLLYGWILPAMAQDKPAPAPPAPTTAPTTTAPAPVPATAPAASAKPSVPIPPKSALSIRDAQVEAINLQAQIQQMTQRAEAAQQRLQAAVKAAYTEAKVSPDDYGIDDRSWLFVPLVKPAAPVAPTPSSSKK
jgi:hypothetical protein